MSFTIFPRHAKYGSSSWNRQVVLNKPTTSFEEEKDKGDMTEAQNDALDQRRSMKIELDDSLFKHLQQQVGHDHLTKSNYTATTATLEEATIIPSTSSLGKLKSSLKASTTTRQVASEPSSPKRYANKTVKFDPVYLERICFFEGGHSPNEIQRLDEKTKYPLLTIKYASHWPSHVSSSSLLYQHPHKKVQLLKKSLKVLEGGTCLWGQVAVRNISFEKTVEIRYTLDGWHTFDNVQAQFQYSKGNQLDIFSFDINIEPGMEDRGWIRCTVDMAVRYVIKSTDHLAKEKGEEEEEYWDNNNGYNYQVQIVEANDRQHQYHQLVETISSQSYQKEQEEKEENDDDDDQKEIDKKVQNKDEDDDRLQKPILKTIKSSSLNRYDFSQSLQKAKYQSKSSSETTIPSSDISPIPIQRFHRLSLKPTFEEHIPLSISNYSINNSSERRKAYSAPSSPETSSLIDFFTSSSSSPQRHQQQPTSLPSASYTDLVNKYCFYGSQNPQSSALSIH